MVGKLKRNKSQKNDGGQIRPLNEVSLKKALKDNEEIFKGIFNNDGTVVYRNFQTKDSIGCLIIFVSGMADTSKINDSIMEPVMNYSTENTSENQSVVDIMMNKAIISNEVKKEKDIDTIVGSILYGDTALIIDGYEEVIMINTKGWKTRPISEPLSERVVKGPREGFIEQIAVNMSLIRRRINSPNLKFIIKRMGTETKTTVSICYIEGIANEKILQELLNRLDKIDIDGILASHYLEEFISDTPISPFRTTGYTERPDVLASKLLEGRFGIIADGTPLVVTVPFVFTEYFAVSEDYYDQFIFGSINRMLRYIAFFLTTSVPAIYVALVTYHQEMIPTPLLLSIASAREGVPFPTIVEALALIFTFELLREGGIRLPEPIGPAISITGALVIGQAAVDARFVSAPITIITALTGIATFLIYPMKSAVIVIRLIFLISAGFLGLYGYIFAVIGLFIHLMSIRSFGIPYMLNIGSINPQDIKDTFIRAPWWYMKYRPKLIAQRNPIRQKVTGGKGSR